MPSFRRPTWSLCAWLPLPAVALLLLVLFTWPYWQGRTYARGDLSEQVLPWRAFSAVCLQRGELGLWDPFLARGYPRHAEGQAGLWHPAHLLAYRCLPLPLAAALELTLLYPVAWLGMLLLLRRGLRLGWPAALAGGSAFAFSVYLAAHQPHLNLAWIYVHLPWLAWAVLAGLAGPRPPLAAAALAALLGSTLLLGHPQQVWLNGLALLLWTGWLLLRQTDGPPWRGRLAWLAAGALAGVLLGLPQLLATADYLGRSPRGHLAEYQRQNYALPPAALLLQVAPGLAPRGYFPNEVRQTPATATPEYNPQEAPSYLGLGLLWLAGLGLLASPATGAAGRRARGFLAAGLLAVVLLALGSAGGLNRLLGALPGLAQFRCPGRHLSILAFFLALGTGLALEALRRRPDALRSPAACRYYAATAILVLAAPLAACRPAWRGDLVAADAAAGLLFGPCLLAWLGLLLWGWQRWHWHWCLGLLAASAVLEPGWRAQRLLNADPGRPLAELASLARALAAPPPADRDLANNNQPLWTGRPLANGYLGIAPPEELCLTPEGGSPERLRAHLALASVTRIHTREGVLALPFPACPRARLVPSLRHSSRPLAETAVAPAVAAWCRPEVAPAVEGPPLSSREAVAIAESRADSIRMTVQVEQARLLILSDRWWPDWRAWADGRERPVLPLYDGMLRGVWVQPGDREILWRYQPRLLRPAAWAAGLGAVGVAVFLLLGLRRKSWPLN